MPLQDYAKMIGKFDPIAIDQQIAETRGAQQRNRLADFAFAEDERKLERDNALRQTTRNAFDQSTWRIDANKFRGGLAEAGDYSGLLTFEKSQAEQVKAQREAEKERIASAKSQIDLIGQVAGGAKDEQSYKAGLATLQRAGIDISQLPKEYDSDYVAQARVQAMDASKQIEQVWKQKEYDLNTDKFDYQKKNDAANRDNQLKISTNSNERSRQNHLEMLAVKQDANNIARTKATTGGGKPIPATALKMQQEELDAIGIGSTINADLGSIEKQISDGKLEFGLIGNLINRGRNFAGASTEESRNFSSFKSTLEKLRNDSLRLNKGVQTEGDSVRAWNELFENINDQGVVTQRLAEIKKTNDRAVNLRKMNVDNIRSNYGHDPLDTSGYENQAAAVGAGSKPKQPTDRPAAQEVKQVMVNGAKAEARLAPDGKYYIKQANGKYARVD